MLTVVRRVVPSGAEALGADLHPVLRRVYAARGLRSRDELKLTLERLAPVGTLGGAEAAAQLLVQHRNGRVLVIGDFDADGATSTALILRALRAFGFAAVDFLVPNRFEFGYGLTPEIVAVAAERAPTLIVTVDNGISSHAGVRRARARGIDVLITDHHLPGAGLPEANVIVNPNVPGSSFASRALAGVGVAFYVLRGAAPARSRLRRSARRRAGDRLVPRSGGARHRRRCGAARCQQPHAGGAGPGAHPRRALRAGHKRAAGGGAARRAVGPGRQRSGLCRRATTECRRPARATCRSASAAC